MSFAAVIFLGALIGFGATVVTDLVGLFRQGLVGVHGFCCLVGRWLGSLVKIGPSHQDIRQSPPVRFEAALGWAAHVALGLCFGVGFLAVFGEAAVSAPQIWQGVSFGIATVLVPWLIFQPFFGWGLAMSKAPDPWRMRLRGLITHGVFGVGLWVSAWGVQSFLS